MPGGLFDVLRPRVFLIALLALGSAGTGMRAQTPSHHPAADALSLWRSIQDALTAENGAHYFEQIQDCEVPPTRLMFEGPVVSQPSPAELIVKVDNPNGDARLKFDHALPPVSPGTYIYFKGVVDSYTKSPYRLTLSVEDEGVLGLPSH
ncbi:MAG TPA: hypothetical protein VG273_17115 [Bryobacteraceae bacterium]|nr:hypothetical protein [Bryobacteraceae bacterium]